MSDLNPKKQVLEKRIERTIKNLENHFFAPYYAKNIEDVKTILNEIISHSDVISFGGSMTLKDTGLAKYLGESFKLVRRSDFEDDHSFYKARIDSDAFICSANAIVESGYIVNVDGLGDRVAASIYGPSSVIIIAGVNKIVGDIPQAFERIKNIAAPANNIRLKTGNPCTKTGVCMDCKVETRICSNYVIMGPQGFKNRVKVILVNEDLGF